MNTEEKKGLMKILSEDCQLVMFWLYENRIKDGAFERFSFKNKWFDSITLSGHDDSINYYDRICLN